MSGCRVAADRELNREREEKESRYDGPAAAALQEFENTVDPTTGRVPRELLWPAIVYTDQLKQDLRSQFHQAKVAGYGWTERGPNTDTIGSSNGNTRSGSGATSGRIRALMVDKGDTSGNTVFVGGVGGGVWKTTNITSRPAGWILLDDKLSNLAVTSICQDPKRPDTMYFCTGEPNYNSDAVQGDGIFKSIDGGNTFTQLSATTNASSGAAFSYCSKIICDSLGNVYVGTRSGLKRSTNFGVSWTDITPNSVPDGEISDIQVSSTGRLHITTGLIRSTGTGYRYTDNAATASDSSGWSAASSGFPTSGICHTVLACQGDTLLALPAKTSGYQVSRIYSSTNGGSTWSALANTPGFTSGQGWYCLAAAINPRNTSQFFVGSLDCYLTTNAGATSWSKVSEWYGTSGNYIHADQQNAIWYHTSTQNRILVVSDGGVFISTDGGNTFSDRNFGLRIKQFFSVAIHPTSTNYLLGGAQDNGCHQLNNAGLSNSVEVTGGDGATVQIDQNEARYQFGSYVYNDYRRSIDSGTSWSNITLSSNTGRFINPPDYDNVANIMYCGNSAGTYRRWTNPQTGNFSVPVTISNLNGSIVHAIAVSPYTANTVYFGTASGVLVKVPNAHTTSSSSTGTMIDTLNTQISSINFGGSEDTIIVTSTNYSGVQIYYSTNGTSANPSWVSKDGNLPNIPVRSALLIPGTGGRRAIVATETGVWITTDITASTPVWLPDPNFPNVSTHMLRYRPSDGLVAAATHGRGMWSANVNDLFSIALPINNFVLKAQNSGAGNDLSWMFSTARTSLNFQVEKVGNRY